MAKSWDHLIFDTVESAKASEHNGAGRNKVYRVKRKGSDKELFVIALSPGEACARAARRLGIYAELCEDAGPPINRRVEELREILRALTPAERRTLVEGLQA
jgi:hypothetical protein